MTQTSPQKTASDGLPSPQRQRAMLVIILGIAVAVLDGTIVNLALPGIARELHASAAQSIWVVNAYQLAVLVMLLPLASLGDLVGFRRIYLAGVALFSVASLGATFAHSLETLIVARALQGLGAAGIMSVNAALVRLIFPSAQLGRGMAINSLVVATASVAGPSVAAAILSVASWPWLFALNVPLGVLVLSLGWRALPFNTAAPARGSRFSLLDVALNIAMFALIFVGADRLGVRSDSGQGGGWSAWLTLLAGLAVGAFYLRRQTRLSLPLFPVDLLRIPVFALSMGTSVAAFCAQMLSYIALPFLLLDVYGRTHIQAGLLITAWPLAIVVFAPIAGRLIGRYPDGLLGGIGLGLLAAGLALLAALPAEPSNLDIVWRMALCGAGFGLFQSPNNHTIVSAPPAHRSGAASGMLGTARLTGQTIGAVLLAGIFSVWSPHHGRGPVIALVLASICAAVAGVFSSLRLRTPVPSH
ncbi:MFS transporter [Variovorax ginsengisoli]|uniref:DHA2 family multidrug resistance protein-like MFS transporter n=1 Tax=Variovorax ginsengisoli TaxID=363844 RepID=A0ABT9S3F0_9BURK|nr:MFS transporter [Variovorax ginsengisoli]MDP9898870.1 DHA2 family multidrug resistance protein-like MFS transporter [Variovorax ginsengisoli]